MPALSEILTTLPDLDADDLHQIVRTVREIIAGRETTGLIDKLREVLADHDPAVATVAFGTTQHDNGWFYDPSCATLTLVDGDVVKDVMIYEADDYLTELSSADAPLGRTAGMTVTLATGEVDADDYMFA